MGVTETLRIIDHDRLTEATLWDNDTITIHIEDADGGAADNRYDLDEIRRIHAALGHLLWLADNRDDED